MTCPRTNKTFHKWKLSTTERRTDEIFVERKCDDCGAYQYSSVTSSDLDGCPASMRQFLDVPWYDGRTPLPVIDFTDLPHFWIV